MTCFMGTPLDKSQQPDLQGVVEALEVLMRHDGCGRCCT